MVIDTLIGFIFSRVGRRDLSIRFSNKLSLWVLFPSYY